ncbi:PTPRS-like protein [Mya arenaria]|uniref:PTPRS-like protein n=1 Tax=Mya arenaria TaxID=6604 RepID=A0ABY7F4I6_MYAAR|nr:PTPRS-like protein [Mya arenaria]
MEIKAQNVLLKIVLFVSFGFYLCGACPINCNGTCDDSSQTCYSCNRGYHGQFCNLTCPGKCADSLCYTNGSCLSCELGYYGNSCNMECKQMCESNKCRQNDGLCEVCPANCVSCESNGTCTRCKESKYGEICHLSCNDECTDKMCNIKGVCFNCSSVSAFGSYCNLTCNYECNSSSCDRTTGACNSCKNNSVFGMFCNETCSPFCLGKECKRENGVCLNGCRDGYFGTKCDQECSHGCQNGSGTICDLEGACLGGCTEGFVGKRCTSATSNTSTIPAIVGGIGGVVVTAAIVVTILFLLRKRKTRKPDEEYTDDGVGNEYHTIGPVSDDLDEERRTQKRKVAKKVEENVYYIGIQDIEKRKVKVEELAVFVAGKTLAYYEEEFDGFRERNAYIASLGPMSKQMEDFGMFWNMIWQQKVEKIVMVTNLMEEGKEKCEQYWPRVGTTKDYSVVKGESERQLHHLHFTAWPDKGIPEDVTALIEFRHGVLNSPALLGGPTLEQYEFLHLALVHTLTFNCEQIPGKQFHDYMIETSKGDLIRQFKAFQAKQKYIVAQSPMPNTVQDFLTLAYQEHCSCIVSFEQSDGKKDIGEYDPADNQVLKKGQLSILSERDKVKNEYSVQKWLTIEFKGSTQSEGGKSTLRHFEFTDWNQTGNVPCSPANYVAFLRDVKMASSKGPVLVHCRHSSTSAMIVFWSSSARSKHTPISAKIYKLNVDWKTKLNYLDLLSCRQLFICLCLFLNCIPLCKVRGTLAVPTI